MAEAFHEPQQLPVKAPARVNEAEAYCPDHGLAWTLRPGGVSKTTGKPYDAFWTCPSQDRPFCKNKPSAHWTAIQEVAS